MFLSALAAAVFTLERWVQRRVLRSPPVESRYSRVRGLDQGSRLAARLLVPSFTVVVRVSIIVFVPSALAALVGVILY
jgi:hypothetical protein